MKTQGTPEPRTWLTVWFQSRGQRTEFMDQVRLWNRVEGLPRIETILMDDARCLKLSGASGLARNVLRLVDACGGLVSPQGGPQHPVARRAS